MRLHLEQLESRYLLAGDFGGTADQPPLESPAPITWFESFDEVPRIEFESLAAVDAVYPDGFQGPRELAAGEWILQLTGSAASRIHVLQTADQQLDDGTIEFTIIAGLGAEGLVLVRGEGVTASDIEASLERNDAVESLSLNSIITGQATTPNDSDYTPGLLTGLTTIGAEAAWDESTGSMQTVVGVIDSGIDLDHPDLYLNIWINQGEIPATLSALQDIDGDGLITFYDLNNLQVIDGSIYVASTVVTDGGGNFVSGDLATEEQLTTATPYATGLNADYVQDLAGKRDSVNGRIDALDLLADTDWSDGRDTDGNGFFDDLFGVNFRSGEDDPFPPNEPDDVLGHGTHVAGTIGAVGNNHIGVVGVNWQTSLMPLRILDNDNRSDAGAGLRAVNYAKMMRGRLEVDDNNRTTEGANVRVLNNSWGQPGGYEPAFEAAIGELGDAGILFVAAAGNGDIFGNGVDNDQTPFYPASYEADNVIAVAAATPDDHLATFSNYGGTSVDIAAPGTGIRSTLKGGGYGTANGTSMASPHVAGAAALVWSAYPQATVDEIHAAILSETSVDPIANGSALVTTGGRLSVAKAIGADVFAPSAVVIAKENITTTGGRTTEFTVEYSHRDGIDLDSIDDNDVIVTRQWGPADEIPVTLKPGTKAATPTGAIATYIMEAPGGGTFTNSTPVVIDGAIANTITSQIYIDDIWGVPADITVSLNIDHTRDQDLNITLIAPDGMRSVLVSGKGGTADNFTNTTFDDGTATSIADGTAPFTGTFRPEESILPLIADGISGSWTLEIEDIAAAEGGTLQDWSLNFAPRWDAMDYGEYLISTVEGNVKADTSDSFVESRPIGAFNVKIEDDPSILYVEASFDSLSPGSLRSTIIAANAAAPAERTIILKSGTYTINLAPVVDSSSIFGSALESLGIDNPGGWSNENSGDFDITGNVSIIGDTNDETIVDSQLIDRGFKVHRAGSLSLSRLAIQGGKSPSTQGGGGILSVGELELQRVTVRGNVALGPNDSQPAYGGAIAVWGGSANLHQSWITENEADFGGGVYYSGEATGSVQRSTFDQNRGGGLYLRTSVDVSVENSTFSANIGGHGAIAKFPPSGFLRANGASTSPSISADGRYVAFESEANNLVPGDTNNLVNVFLTDIFVQDRVTGTIERVSISDAGVQPNGNSTRPVISADGQYVAFESDASNLVPGDTNNERDIFLYDRNTGTIKRINVSETGVQAASFSGSPVISADGRYVAFHSQAGNLVPADSSFTTDVFVYDRTSDTIERVSVTDSGGTGNGHSSKPSISADGRYVAFSSSATNFVPGDTNNRHDVFVFDRSTSTIERISTNDAGAQGDNTSNSAAISADGQYVAFASNASNLVAGDTNGEYDIFVYDRSTDKVERVSISNAGVEGNARSYAPSISGDGQLVVFYSKASYLDPDNTDETNDIFLYDRNVGTLEQVSVGDGGLLGYLSDPRPAISADGRYVVFDSDKSNLAPGDLNGKSDIFVYDRSLDNIQPETLAAVGTVSNGPSDWPAISDDGGYVAFESDASNLVPGDTNDQADIFVRDRSTDTVERVSISDAGVEADGLSTRPAISPDGLFVAFESEASNLVPGDTNGQSDIFVYSRSTGTTERVNLSDAGVQANDSSHHPSISADGQYVTFYSYADNLVPGDTNDRPDIFVYQRGTGTIEMINISDVGIQANSISYSPVISANGQYVAFESSADNLVPGDTNGQSDIFVHDRSTGTIERVSMSDAGIQANGSSRWPAISRDGQYVTFMSYADNLVPQDTNGQPDIFVYERTTGKIELVSISDEGVQGNYGSSRGPAISADGRHVTFESYADNLVPGDTNNASDVFAYDRSTGSIERVSISNAGVQGGNSSSSPAISADGRYVAFSSRATNMVAWDTNSEDDIFVYDRSLKSIQSDTFAAKGTVTDVSHTTIAFSGDLSSGSTVRGNVQVQNSLFFANQVAQDLDVYSSPVSFNNVFSEATQTDFIAPLVRFNDLPPVHRLSEGNPAIDAAVSSGNIVPDQLGQVRRDPADIGAVEATDASVSGVVYFDRNQNGRLDTGEPGIANVDVNVTSTTSSSVVRSDAEGNLNLHEVKPERLNFNVALESGTHWSVFIPPIELIRNGPLLANSSINSGAMSADGRYVAFSSNATNLVTGDTNNSGDVFVYDRNSNTIERVSINAAGVQGDSSSSAPTISADGRYVAFDSNSTNLVAGDLNNTTDIFVYDRSTGTIERVSFNDTGVEGDDYSGSPSISADCRYVAFQSRASNLVPGDTNGQTDIFVHDRITGTVERVSISDAGVEGDDSSLSPKISADGLYVTFISRATNLVPEDTNGKQDVFLYDRSTNTIERISVNDAGVQGDGNNYTPAISANGQFVTFRSYSRNLIPEDTSGNPHILVYDRNTRTIEPVSINDVGVQANRSYAPTISADGRYVAYYSDSSILVPGISNGQDDIFIYDRSTSKVVRVSISDLGVEGNGASRHPVISADGRYLTFTSYASNLVAGDSNNITDLFIVFNPLAEPGLTRDLQAGEFFTELKFGLVPDPGVISGRVFEDVVANGVYDEGEPLDVDTTVFLDLNLNRQLDEGEPFANPDAEGRYEFTNTDAHLSYAIAALSPIGYEQVAPGASDDFVWDIFLPAGGTITNRDFGFRRAQATGQSSASVVTGRVFEDKDGNGFFDAAVDTVHSNIPIYLDGNSDRKHTTGANEPIVRTEADGTFEISDLGSRIVTVRTKLGEDLKHVTPLGNSFDLQTSSLFTGVSAFSKASDATHADFDQDGFEDLAVLLSDGNQLAIRLNDQNGAFPASDINISLGPTDTQPGTSLPLEMVVGQFNADAADRTDVAIVGQSTGNVLILLDFDKDTGQFASRQTVDVGENPISITSGYFDAGDTLDLAVVNFGTSQLVQASPAIYAKINESFQILTNDGVGTFTAHAPVPVPGDDPVAIVSDDFNGDTHADIAVLHNGPTFPNSPFGDATLFTGNGANAFAESHREPVEGGPLEMVSGDFNGDGIADLAVANVSQNTMSILAGRADGAVIRETAHPIGTGEKGIDSMDVADIDNDGDLDIVATRLSDGGVAVFRNITDTTADPLVVQFEPLESFGVAQASVFERAPIVLANFDNDTSGPNGEGTIDIIAIPKSTATVNVLLNTLVDGGHRVALDGLNTIGNLDFIITPTGDVVAPLVTDVRVAGSGWATSFKSAVDPQNLRGAEVPGPTALRPLSWNGLDTLFVEFSEDIQKASDGIIDAADLTLVGVNVPNYETASEFGVTTSYTNGGGDGPFLLTIQLAGAADFGADRIVLGIGDSIVDLAGNPLGGNSIFGFNVLPGDVDGSGGVLATDVLTVNASQFTFAGAVGYDAFRDIDGSGAVFANDVLLTNSRQFTFLPPEPSPPAEGEAPVLLMVDAEGEDAGAAGVKLFGEIETFNGPGTYTLDMFVEAVGGPVSIAGFNAPLLVDGTGVSFAGDETAFAPNASFDLEFVTGLGTPGVYGVAGSLGPGLQLDAGQSEILFSIDLVVDSNFDTPADVVSIITDGPFASALQFTDADLATIQDVTIESAARIVVPVPPVVLLNSLATEPADLPSGAQPSSWDTQRDQIRDIVIELQTPIAALPDGGISLTNRGVNDGDPETVIELRVDQVSLDAAGTVITILLDAKQLPDGPYRLELSPEVTSGSAFAFTADDQNRFFVLSGDWDGNSSVDLRDLATFAYWSGIPGGAPGYVNDDGIGGITIDDLAGFEANYAIKLDVPGMTESIDPDWIDAEAFERAKATIIERTDVNGSSTVSPLDALHVINRIATEFVGTTDWQYDVNRDAEITPRDALFVINAIARASLSDLNPGEASSTESIALRSSTTVAAAEAPTESLSDAPTVILDLVGGRQTYSGPGTYTFDFTITAIGGDQTIAGFNLPLRFDVPGVTFGGTIDDFVRNPAFSYEYVAPLSQANHFGVAASGSSGLALAQGQTAVLFSIVVDVSASVDVASELEIAIPITEGADAQGIQFIGTGIEVIDPPNFVRGAVLAPPGPGIQLTGVVQELNGAGTYTLDFIAEAVGGPVSIAGFNAPLMVDVPGVTFAGDTSAFHPNASFQNGNEYVTSLALPNAYGVAASLGDVLQLAEGERVVLFSIDVAVDPSAGIGAAAEVAKIITSGTLASSLQLIDPDAEPILDVFVGANAILARAIDPVVMINDGSSTRSQITSLVVTFDALVDHTDLATAFRLTNLDSGLAVGAIQVAAVDQGTQTIATLTFDGVSTIARQGTGSLGNSLADGNYRLDIFAQQVQSSNGQQLFRDEQFGDNATDLLFRFFGDTDGDRDVDGQDYGRFGLGFLKSFDDPGYDAPLDSDGDGDIDGQDYGRFGLNFLKSM
ncbi:S8 family serine peptidase [Stieleria neptunia]|uniref:S8 family serine peptidase n=1 Tax=Stieleria neptunia TaxID=2527979 RepID=UPI0018D1FCCF|nr:S8 family serine peptidase [Stieleria neptunia]